MNVKQKAKAFEDKQSVVRESPPPKKKSREEHIGSISDYTGYTSDENETTAKAKSAPLPPLRKSKKNGTLKQPEESSPQTERKENVPEIIPTKPTSLSKQQSNVTEQKKRPKPPPPPRGSSLGRNTSVPGNLQSSSREKKPRPPIPPKPKNYVPKKFSSSSGVKIEGHSVTQLTKERADSARVVSTCDTSENHGSQFFFNLEKGSYTSAVHSKSPDSENSSQFFVPLDKQAPRDDSVGTEDVPRSERQVTNQPILSSGNDVEVNSVRDGKADSNKVCENGRASPQSRTIFYDHISLTEDLNSGKESPDPLEGLEIEADALSDDEFENFAKTALEQEEGNVLLSESVDVNNGVVATDNLDIVVREQSSGEVTLAENAGGSKENVKVLFNLVLEEECSVSMIDDTVEGQKLVDVTLNETTDLSQMEQGPPLNDIGELSNKTEHIIDHECGDERVELTAVEVDEDTSNNSVAEPLLAVNKRAENVLQIGAEKPIEDTQPCDTDIISEKSVKDTQVNVVEDEISVEELHEKTVDQNVELEADVQLELQGNELQNQELENGEAIAGTSMKLTEGEVQEKREIIVAEPIREGTFISVSDHAISSGSAEVAVGHQAPTDEEAATDSMEESKMCVSLPDDTVVVQTDLETPSRDDFVQLNVAETASKELESKNVDLELGNVNEEESSASLQDEVSVEITDKEHVVQTENVDSSSCTERLEHLEMDETVVAAATEHTLLEATNDAAESTVNDVSGSNEGFKDNETDTIPVETTDIFEESELQENKNDIEPQSPSSPEPVRPERPNRKAKQGKHTYENVELVAKEIGKLQEEERKKDSIPRRSHSYGKYESVVLSQQRPVQRVSDDEAIYRVPRKTSPVQAYAADESVYSVPYAIPTRRVVEQNEYSVPKPIVVQAHAVTERQKADENGEIYAVPGLPTPVPVETFTERSNKDVNTVPQESDNIYVIPGKHSAVTMVTATVSAVPPPKPPRSSLFLEQDKKEKSSVEEASTKESPKPVPRMRGVSGNATPEVKDQKSSPTPIPRKGGKTETAESAVSEGQEKRASPSPVPRKVSKTEAAETAEQRASPSPVPRNGGKTEAAESEVKEQRASPSPVPRKGPKTESSESVTSQGSGSPVPIPRSRLNALQSNKEAVPSPPVALSSSEVSVEESAEDEATSKRKVPPPPRPPPPVRISVTSSEGSMHPPLSPGFGNDLDSGSDSDVGEEEVPKGPPKPKKYYIAHEILSTERTFVDALKLVFEECYTTIKSANVVPDSVLGDIFGDLENIYLLDSRFLQELEERMLTWDEHERIGDIIKKYGHFLKMYTQYVNGYDKAMSVFQDTMKENPEFANLVTQFQASERCQGLVLSSYMLKPVQRIPSYRLLLIDYLKHLPKDSEECKDTETTLKIVSEVATHINESMKKMDSFEQLLKLQNMLVGHPEIVKAGRDYLREGMLMKLCRKDMQERMFFLLTDVLLYTTPIGGNQYKLNKMLPLLGMQVTVPDSPDFVNEFSIISTTRSFTLTASTPEERDDWVEALNNAIDVVTKRKITFVTKTKDATGLLEPEVDASKLGEKAPVWIPDARVTMCMSCTSPFTLTNRRHHCRACGNVVCGSCSDSTAPLAYLDYTQARVCDKCYDLLLKEFHTDEIHVATDEPVALPPLLQETDAAEKLLRKPTKFEMMRRFKSRKSKRKSQIIHPTHLTEVVANQEGIQMSGYLRFKKGRHGWKKSWFVLKDNVLYSYKASSDVVALETMPVLGYVIEDLGKEGDDFIFQLKHQGVPPIVFKADNETSAKRWVQELTKATTM